MKHIFFAMAGILTIGLAQPTITDAHGDEPLQGTNVEHHIAPTPGMFLVKKEIDGYTVSFHVMKAKKSMQHGGTYNLMVKVEKNGKAITDILINSKVSHPNKESESKMLMKMGDWYMAGYSLSHPGPHQIMVLFKTSDGKKHFGGIEYQEQRESK